MQCVSRSDKLIHWLIKTDVFFAPDQRVSFFAGCFTCIPDSFELVNWGTWHRCKRWGMIVEWRNLVTGEKTPLVIRSPKNTIT